MVAVPNLNNGVVQISNEVMVIDSYIDNVALRVEVLPKIIKFAIRATNHRDWVKLGGNPYLCGSGAEKIARIFGIITDNVSYERIERTDDKGEYYMYVVKGRVSLPAKMTTQGIPLADSIISIGTCTSRDGFFAKAHGQMLPVSEIDEGNILKSAQTNFLANGITKLLGLRNLTWDDLREHGVAIEQIAEVEYGKGRKSGEPALMSPKQRALITDKVLHSHLLTDDEKDAIREQMEAGMTISDASNVIDTWKKRHEKDEKPKEPKPEPKADATEIGSEPAGPAAPPPPKKSSLQEWAQRKVDEHAKASDEARSKNEAKPNGTLGMLANEDDIKAVVAIIEHPQVMDFERFMLNKRASDKTFTKKHAASVVAHWKAELVIREQLAKENGKKLQEHLTDKLNKMIAAYPCEYDEFVAT